MPSRIVNWKFGKADHKGVDYEVTSKIPVEATKASLAGNFIVHPFMVCLSKLPIYDPGRHISYQLPLQVGGFFFYPRLVVTPKATKTFYLCFCT
jgi:hypothetical protein